MGIGKCDAISLGHPGESDDGGNVLSYWIDYQFRRGACQSHGICLM